MAKIKIMTNKRNLGEVIELEINNRFPVFPTPNEVKDGNEESLIVISNNTLSIELCIEPYDLDVSEESNNHSTYVLYVTENEETKERLCGGIPDFSEMSGYEILKTVFDFLNEKTEERSKESKNFLSKSDVLYHIQENLLEVWESYQKSRGITCGDISPEASCEYDALLEKLADFIIQQSNHNLPHFLDDEEKMNDFKVLTKEEFLSSYSYLTEEEYYNTAEMYFLFQGDSRSFEVDDRIRFKERYEDEEYDTTTFYFIAPKAFLQGKYPEAEHMEISVEIPTSSIKTSVKQATVMFSPSKDGSDYDWYDAQLDYNEVEALIKIALDAEKAIAERQEIERLIIEKIVPSRFNSVEVLKNALREVCKKDISLQEAQLTEEEVKELGCDYQLDGTFGENVLGFSYADFVIYYIKDNRENIFVTGFAWM